MEKKEILSFFSALSDETRLDIVLALIEGERTVSQIHKGLSHLTLSGVSHQLHYLWDKGILEMRRNGRERYYSLSDTFCWCILKDAQRHGQGKCGCGR
ncbi:MAG: ArsR/SmtB family transcription factor [Nanoarchaeota archaeon]